MGCKWTFGCDWALTAGKTDDNIFYYGLITLFLGV